ncbi:hypothetical protein LEMLEM_LOCUS8391 [Lemmus lemmus]
MCGERFPRTRLSSEPSGVSEQGTVLKTALAFANKPRQTSQALYLRDLRAQISTMKQPPAVCILTHWKVTLEGPGVLTMPNHKGP